MDRLYFWLQARRAWFVTAGTVLIVAAAFAAAVKFTAGHQHPPSWPVPAASYLAPRKGQGFKTVFQPVPVTRDETVTASPPPAVVFTPRTATVTRSAASTATATVTYAPSTATATATDTITATATATATATVTATAKPATTAVPSP